MYNQPFSCSQWLKRETIGQHRVFIRLGMRHLGSHPEFSKLAQDWATAVQLLPEKKRPTMVRWWETAVCRQADVIADACRTLPCSRPKAQSFYLRLDMLVCFLTVVEWLELGGRSAEWQEYTGGAELSKNFIRDLKAYEQRSKINRGMLMPIIHRRFKGQVRLEG